MAKKHWTRSTAWLPVAQKVSLFVLRTPNSALPSSRKRVATIWKSLPWMTSLLTPKVSQWIPFRWWWWRRLKLANVRARNCIKRCRNVAGMSKKARWWRLPPTNWIPPAAVLRDLWMRWKRPDSRKNKFIRYLPNLTTSRGHLTLPTQCWFNIRKLNIGWSSVWTTAPCWAAYARRKVRALKRPISSALALTVWMRCANCLKHRQPASTVPCCQARTYMAINPAKCFTTG